MKLILNSNLLFACMLTLLFACQVCVAGQIEIAITVDDLPSHAELPQGTTRADIAKQMLAAFKKHHITGVYGLINGNRKDAEGVLQQWVLGGQLLGNHSYSHMDLDEASTAAFIADIEQNTPLLKKLMGDKNYRFFRYPYLAEGNTQEKRDQVRQFLFKNDYQIAAVTTDFFDFAWNAPYARCLRKNDLAAISWLQQSFIEQALNAITISHHLSTLLFGRDIKNVLLLHIGAFDALMLDDLLTAYENHGVKFISLPDALSDEVYKINPNVITNRTYTFLNQIRLSRGLSNPKQVDELYRSLPEEQLDKLCR